MMLIYNAIVTIPSCPDDIAETDAKPYAYYNFPSREYPSGTGSRAWLGRKYDTVENA